jgi:hypothetical protein
MMDRLNVRNILRRKHFKLQGNDCSYPFVIQTERKQLSIYSSLALSVLNVGGKLASPGISI